MSGGSFEYLVYQDNPRGDLVVRMAEELDALAAEGVEGAAEAAARTREYLQPEQDEPVREVWRAVEWWRSCDWGRDQVEDALRDFLRNPDSEPYDPEVFLDGFDGQGGMTISLYVSEIAEQLTPDERLALRYFLDRPASGQ